jgi:hypothetical protein
MSSSIDERDPHSENDDEFRRRELKSLDGMHRFRQGMDFIVGVDRFRDVVKECARRPWLCEVVNRCPFLDCSSRAAFVQKSSSLTGSSAKEPMWDLEEQSNRRHGLVWFVFGSIPLDGQNDAKCMGQSVVLLTPY